MQGKKSARKSGKRFFNPIGLSHFIMKTSSSTPLQSKNYNAQSGNIFFALFGAVALVGVVGAGTMAIMRGPLSTMVEVQNRTQAESEMAIASRLSLLEATELAASGDCDGDGFVEPLEWTDAGGNGPLGGGGFLPSEVSSARQDPWGTDYGYCAWDAGNVLDFPGTGYPDSCDNGGGSSDGDYNRLAGNGSATDDTYTIVALISAGANQQFETTCSGGATPDVAKGGDDIVVEYTYETAVTATNGLWNIKSGEPGVAEINKEIEVAGNIDLSRGGVGTGQLQLGAGSMIYPDQTVLSVCPGASNVNVGLLRMNTSTTPYRLEICDASGWVSSGGTGVWTGGTGNDIYYNVGTPEVGIGTATPSHTLEVVGTFDNSGAVTFGSTLDVTGATTLAALTATGAVDFDTTLNVDGATTLTATTVTTLNATDAVDFDSTLNVDGATTLTDTTVTTLNATGAVDFDATLNVDDASTFGGTIDAQADIANSTGSVSFNDGVVISGTLDAQGAISNSGGNVSISDDLDIIGDLDVNGDGDFDGTLEADDYTFGGVDFTPDADCDDTTEKVVWNAGSGWGCADDENDGSGVGPGTTVAGVFEVDESATPDLIRMKTAVGTGYGTVDFVFGSPQLADDGDVTHDGRMLFDKSKSAFRAGLTESTHWDDANIGLYSMGLGYGPTASGQGSIALGTLVNVSGNQSMGVGLGTAAGTRPVVSANSSFGVFMGDQSTYNLNTANRFGIVGGDLMVDDGVSTSAKGCIRYNGTSSKLEFSDDCTTFSTLTSLGTPGGANTQVQYNKSGAFAGDAGMTYDDASDTLTIGRAVVISGQTGSAPIYMNLGDLGDVSAATPADNECLVYDDPSNTWVNGSCATGVTNLADADNDTKIQVEEAADEDTIRFDTAGTERMVIDSTGKVGIGTAPTTNTLTVLETLSVSNGTNSVGRIRSHNGHGRLTINDSNGVATTTIGAYNPLSPNYIVTSTGLTLGSGSMARGELDMGYRTTAFLPPIGTTAQRPNPAVGGMIRYNTDATPKDRVEYYDAETAAWLQLTDAASTGLWTDNTTHITRSNFHVLNTGETMTSAGFDGASASGMIYHADKQALRIGNVNGVQWNEANIGTESLAVGVNSRASGSESFALAGGTASAAGTLAIGYNVTASGSGATGIGASSVASGGNSFALGRSINVTGNSSFAAGNEVDISGAASFALGLGDSTGADPIVSAGGSAAIFMGDNGGYNMSVANRFGIVGGHFMVDDAGATGSQGCLKYDGANSKLQYSHDCTTYVDMGTSGTSEIFQVTGAAGSELVSAVNAAAPYATSDFVFGSPQLAGNGNADHHSRMFFDKSKGAFRAGREEGTNWDNANVGTYSVALGYYPTASSYASIAIGRGANSSSTETVAIGSLASASGAYATAVGRWLYASGANSVALGSRVTVSGTYSGALGLGNPSTTMPVVSAANSFGVIMGDQSGYNLSVANRFGIVGGHFMVDDAGATGSQGCIQYDGTNSKLQYSHDCTTYVDMGASSSEIFQVTGTAGSELVSAVDATAPYATSDFVFGSPQLADDANTNHDKRMFFDKSKGAFRSGSATDQQWDNANVGAGSTGFGGNVTVSGGHAFAAGSELNVSGDSAAAVGYGNTASGSRSFVTGYGSTASQWSSVAMGGSVSSSGSASVALGQAVAVSGANSMGLGLGAAAGTRPTVSAANSFGIFMGDQSGYTLATANRMALVGGHFMVDDAGATGSQGCIQYDGANSKLQYSHDCTTYVDMGGSSSSIFQVTGAAGSELVSAVDATAPYATSDFVFGSPQLADDGNADHDQRMFFDKSKAAFRFGTARSTQWDNANVGGNSFAGGWDTTASGFAAFAFGNDTTTSSYGGLAIGTGVSTSGGDMAYGLGKDVTVTGSYALGIGLGDATGANPTVSGDSSFGIFMGNQGGITLAQPNTMAVLGGDFIVGSYQLDDTTTGNQDKRMFFDVSKGAFRAGEALGTEWNDASVGIGSFAAGQSTTASGDYSVALGTSTTASSNSSFAMGENSEASNSYSVAFGENATSSGYASFAGGESPYASGNNAFAYGNNVVASGDYSVAFGQNNSAAGASSFVAGYNSSTATFYDIAMGSTAISSGGGSIALGTDIRAYGSKGIAIGEDVIVGQNGGGPLGTNSMGIGLGVASGGKPEIHGSNSLGIFMGDQSGTTLAQDNTMAIIGGSVGIGVIAPNVELDIEGDIEYTGTITDVSDRRLKDNIEPLDKTGSLLERLDQVDTYRFTMKNDANNRIEYGVMAQELETIFPELVHTAKDDMGTKSVNYIGLIAPMIEATKELKAQNDALKTAQVKTDATLQDLSAQVAVLNKAAGNNVNKASMEGYWMLMLGLLGGMGLMLVIQRKKSS